MSIKSQKSLYEECSEIIERSYSVRSDDESLSGDDDEDCLARELLRKLNPAALSKLRRCFYKTREKVKRDKDIDRRVEEVMRQAAAEEGIEFAQARPSSDDPMWLDEGGFLAAVDKIFESRKYSTHATALFRLLDPFSSGRIRWRSLLQKLGEVGARKTRSRVEVWREVKEERVKRLEHCKRETIVKLVSIERGDSFCYVACSRGGRVAVYTGLLETLYTYEVFYHRNGTQRRVKNCWITDVVYLTDVQCLIMSASDRSLTVYDVAIIAHTPIFCITGLPNIPTCLSYSPMTSELAIGSERGEVTRLRFLQPKLSLFHQKSPDHINYYFWMELSSPPHTSYCSVTIWKKMHTRSVRRLAYTHDGSYLVSCSHDCNTSVRIKHVPGLIDDYVFKVQRGVSCFHLIPSLRLLATGGVDGVVRLWDSTQSSPFASLSTSGAPPVAVLDVVVVPAREFVVAYCSNCWLHFWDLYEECLLQTVKVAFPFLGVLGKKIEFGAFCIHQGPARKRPTDDSSTPSPPPEGVSRRPSVCLSASGGLMVQPVPSQQRVPSTDDDPEYTRFDRASLLVTACDFVCLLDISGGMEAGAPLPPPGDMLRARRPSFWDLPDDVFQDPDLSLPPQLSSTSSSSSLTPRLQPHLLSPATAEIHNLDTLLENAGLSGILEKDFVRLSGLTHDLNCKLADLKADARSMQAAVCAGAPYLGLRTIALTPVPPIDEMMERYQRVLSLLPGPSVTATPTGSGVSTPRKKSERS